MTFSADDPQYLLEVANSLSADQINTGILGFVYMAERFQSLHDTMNEFPSIPDDEFSSVVRSDVQPRLLQLGNDSSSAGLSAVHLGKAMQDLSNQVPAVKSAAENLQQVLSNANSSPRDWKAAAEPLAKALNAFYDTSLPDPPEATVGKQEAFNKNLADALVQKNTSNPDSAPGSSVSSPPSSGSGAIANHGPSSSRSGGAPVSSGQGSGSGDSGSGSGGQGSGSGGQGSGSGDSGSGAGTPAAGSASSPSNTPASALSDPLPAGTSAMSDPGWTASTAASGLGAGAGAGAGAGGIGAAAGPLSAAPGANASAAGPAGALGGGSTSITRSMMGGMMGGGMMPGMGAGSGAKEHKTPDYLYSEDNGYELIEKLPVVSPEVIGALTADELEEMELHTGFAYSETV